jgi:hypothetical protein
LVGVLLGEVVEVYLRISDSLNFIDDPLMKYVNEIVKRA